MISRTKHFIFMAALSMLAMTKAETMSATELIEIFKTYDVEEDTEPECQDEYTDSFICPKDEELPCGPIEDIEKYCASLIGEDVAKKVKNLPVDQKRNPIAGCVKYVGFHLLELDHLACCQSDFCENWIEEKFEDYYDDDDGPYDDDDDDNYYDEDEL
mmetsp:Transcript_3968/g.5174  ORF Transcript_3968/g.5174 Transcript_3968/m.5174 type:complete len:158 (-) Transcript_3968:227-700(-)